MSYINVIEFNDESSLKKQLLKDFEKLYDIFIKIKQQIPNDYTTIHYHIRLPIDQFQMFITTSLSISGGKDLYLISEDESNAKN